MFAGIAKLFHIIPCRSKLLQVLTAIGCVIETSHWDTSHEHLHTALLLAQERRKDLEQPVASGGGRAVPQFIFWFALILPCLHSESSLLVVPY